MTDYISSSLPNTIVNALTTTALGYTGVGELLQGVGHLEQGPLYPRPETVWVTTIETEPISLHSRIRTGRLFSPGTECQVKTPRNRSHYVIEQIHSMT